MDFPHSVKNWDELMEHKHSSFSLLVAGTKQSVTFCCAYEMKFLDGMSLQERDKTDVLYRPVGPTVLVVFVFLTMEGTEHSSL